MDDPIWRALPAETRPTVDEHLTASRNVYAIKAIRDASPGLPDRMDVIADRRAERGLDDRRPTPRTDPATG
ncbi:hypothetical protein ACWC9T_09790 [Kitasatospora sp. NPDC001159]